jgi:signal transduction histidine kinase
MRERATMVGGILTIDSVPGDGTRVRVAVPVTDSVEDDA